MNQASFDDTIIGRGWAFPVQLGARGQIALTGGASDIEQAMRIILSTVPGERPMRPTFGCRAWELVFDPNAAVAQNLMADYVREAIAMWEPRVNVLDVRVAAVPDRAEVMLVEIIYEIKMTHDQRSLVYPFAIEDEAGAAQLPSGGEVR